VADAGYDGFSGPTTVGETLEQFSVWDLAVHRWDLATATGQDARLGDADLDRTESGARTRGEALYAEGICERVEAPAGADRQARVLAVVGRRA
jgi:hypothetical protein